ncbi:unnamed protein product [Somion occarium]|uniref:Uncharacterized protein n=1 Tax=Somion occarium TaxID=3059160 RepID=A0ABP1D6L7_9APHY
MWRGRDLRSCYSRRQELATAFVSANRGEYPKLGDLDFIVYVTDHVSINYWQRSSGTYWLDWILWRWTGGSIVMRGDGRGLEGAVGRRADLPCDVGAALTFSKFGSGPCDGDKTEVFSYAPYRILGEAARVAGQDASFCR